MDQTFIHSKQQQQKNMETDQASCWNIIKLKKKNRNKDLIKVNKDPTTI